jgi:hypothetical protein
MASVLKLKTDIKKLKAAIASKATSAAIKTKLRGKLTSLENELDKLQPKKRKPKTTGPKSESALVRLAKKRRTNQGLSTSKNDIERDAIRPAKKAGKRISASGNTYYEYRDNRIDNRQPPKKYRKLADGGNTSDFDKLIADKFKMNDELDYAEDLKDFILEKYKGESVDGYELKYGTSDGGTPWVWVLTNKNIDLFAEPFVDSLDDGIIVEAYEDEDELINRHEIPFKLTGNLEKDAEKYLKLLKPYFKKYASGKYADGGKTQGYDDKKDESLGMTRSKLSLKDFVGNRKQKEHSRRDDARFEERGKMADGGQTKKEYLFNFVGGGWNSIIAKNKAEAIKLAKAEYNGSKSTKVDENSFRLKTEKDYKQLMSSFYGKGGKTKEQEVVRGYFEDEAYEYGHGGEVMYLTSTGTSQKLVTDKSDATPMFIMDAEYYMKSNPKNSATMVAEKIDETLPDGVGKNYIVKITKKHKMADGGSVAKGNYEMLMSQAKEIMHHAQELMQVAKPNMDVEAWVVGKAERATTDLSDITHYLDGLKMAMGGMVKAHTHKVNG